MDKNLNYAYDDYLRQRVFCTDHFNLIQCIYKKVIYELMSCFICGHQLQTFQCV